MKRVHIISFVILALSLAGCSADERWEGQVFPDRTKLLMHRNAGTYGTLEECESASMKILTSMDAVEKGYYECGKNCEKGSFSYNMNCEEKVLGNYYK